MENPDRSPVAGGRDRWAGFVAGGAAGGFMTAYLELLFLTATVGAFWVIPGTALRALALYSLLGAAAAAAIYFVLHHAWLKRHPLRQVQPWAFGFALLFAGGILLEAAVFLFDIHLFRAPDGRWAPSAYLVLLAAVSLALAAGWSVVAIARRFVAPDRRRAWRAGAASLLILAAVFMLVRFGTGYRDRRLPDIAKAQAAAPPANIVILLIDALRPDHLSAYGYPLPTSPAIDRLAREGALFRDCLAASSWTVPTHASLFSGRLPSVHGAFSLYSQLADSIPTLAQILSRRGYDTASLHDNPLLEGEYGLLRGFRTALNVDNGHKVSLTLQRLWDRLRGERSMGERILSVAGRWIEHERRLGRPYFLFVNLLDVHLPYRPRSPYIEEFLKPLSAEKVHKDYIRLLTSDHVLSKPKADALFPRLSAADWRVLGRYYDSNVRAVDDQIGRFLDRLRARGLLSDTLVIVTADHGEMLGEKGMGAHFQPTLHREALRIPLILWFPARLAAADLPHRVSQLDILPTALRLAGLAAAVPPGGQGIDLFATPPGREVVAEFWDEAQHGFSRAFYTENWKLIDYASGKRELYDVGRDPAERNDLSAACPERLAALRSRLDGFLGALPRRQRRAATRDPEKEKLLRSLGYL
jgi:arylsulfatase A-like enzyme